MHFFIKSKITLVVHAALSPEHLLFRLQKPEKDFWNCPLMEFSSIFKAIDIVLIQNVTLGAEEMAQWIELGSSALR